MTDKEKKELHLNTIKTHIDIVQDLCDKMGLKVEHDKSKFSPEEFDIYKWADGKMSPHDNARAELGYSPSWIYHKARNPHHWEFWTDFNSAKPNGDGTFTIICRPVKMPYENVIEMCCDFVGAGKAYSKEKWTKETPWDYWCAKCEGQRAMHPASEYLLKKLLWNIHEYGLDKFLEWYRKAETYLKEKYDADEVNY